MIGIMQDRIPPGVDQFEFAQAAGLDFIEMVWDSTKPVNTMCRSICADHFIAHPLIDHDGKITTQSKFLAWLIQASPSFDHIVLPFLDNSHLETFEQRDALIRLINWVARRNTQIHLETDWPATVLMSYLNAIDDDASVLACYDTGNVAALGYDAADYVHMLRGWIGSVHIKDRKLGGVSVPLGTGNADFPKIFGALHEINYRGNYVLQTAHAPGRELEQAISDRKFVEQFL